MTDIPPQDLRAEEHVLGAILQSVAALDAVSDILAPDDFYKPSHGNVYQAALRLHARGEPVDTVTVGAELGEGSHPLLGGLVALAPATANAAHHARLVKQAATFRGLTVLGSEIARLGSDRIEDAQEQAEAKVYAFTQRTKPARQVSLPDAVKTVYDELVELDGKPRELLGVPTGLADLDRVTRGFRPGDLIVIAADTGRGKSALWLNATLHLLGQGKPVAALSLEMSEAELIHRALSLDAGIPHDRLTRGEIRSDEWGRLAQACEHLAGYPLGLWTDATIRPAGVRSTLRRWLVRHPETALAVVDYLQLLVPDEKSDSRTQDVGAISRALKVTAMDLQIPIVAVSQLRRRMPNTRPHRNDLRESGSIENDASVVVLIHHDENDPGVAELIVAKNRHGAEGSVRVKWTGDQMRFSNLVHDASRAVA